VAVVGSGPAGLAAAAQLNTTGHTVTVYERSETVGGLMRIGVPDFKLEKWVIDRRVRVLEAEGVEFRCGVEVGTDLDPGELRAGHDAVVLTIGALRERPLDVPGAELDGVHFAMEYLAGHNRLLARTGGRPEADPDGASVTATGKRVAVIGGGDTAADCIATALRERAVDVRQLDRYPRPTGSNPRDIADWPAMPRRMPTTYALQEGGTRHFAETLTELTGTQGHVRRLHGTALGGPPDFAPRPGTGFELPIDLVLVAVGFLGPEQPLLDAFNLDHTPNNNPDHTTPTPGLFLAGDARLGATLVVTAIDDGRICADMVNRYLHATRRA
jgi:glutamate synthase (NADPH/NADH) small chain